MTDELKEAAKRGEEGGLELYADWLKERGDPLGDLITLMQDPGLVRRWSEVGKIYSLIESAGYDGETREVGFTTEEKTASDWEGVYPWCRYTYSLPCVNGHAQRNYHVARLYKDGRVKALKHTRTYFGPEGEWRTSADSPHFYSTRSVEHAMEFARKENA